MKPASCISRMPSSLVAPHTPACVVTGTPSSRATSKAAFSGNAGSPVTSKAIWKPSMSSPASIWRRTKSRNSGRRRPLPGALLDVAVGQHEPAGDGAQRVDRGVGVLDRLQPVRPVHAGGDAGVDALDGGQQVPGVHVLRSEVLAGLQVVPDEVLGERPVGAVAAHRGLPHVPVGVDHARHHHATGGVDLDGALGHAQRGADRGDPVAVDEHVGVLEYLVRVVHRQHRAATQDHRPTCEVEWLTHEGSSPRSVHLDGRRSVERSPDVVRTLEAGR